MFYLLVHYILHIQKFQNVHMTIHNNQECRFSLRISSKSFRSLEGAISNLFRFDIFDDIM